MIYINPKKKSYHQIHNTLQIELAHEHACPFELFPIDGRGCTTFLIEFQGCSSEYPSLHGCKCAQQGDRGPRGPPRRGDLGWLNEGRGRGGRGGRGQWQK